MLTIAAALWLAKPDSSQALTPNVQALQQRAAQRFETERGLSPCDHYDREILTRANAKLLSGHFSDGDIIVVVLPTFSEMKIVTFGPENIASYRVEGESLFAPPISDWFLGPLRLVSQVKMEPKQMYAISTTLNRSITYAMTSPVYGHDGVGYYIGRAGDTCAFTTHPGESGPAAGISKLIEQAASGKPNAALIADLARAVDRYDQPR